MLKIELLRRCSSYHLNVDYDRSDCTRDCGYVCRCTSIINLCVRSVNYRSMIEEVISKKEYHTIKGYCAERIMRHCGVTVPEKWYVGTQTGYYGEEIGQASFEDFNTLEEYFNGILLKKNSQKMMEALLILEYGWLLETLAKRKWTIESVPFKSVNVNQKDYYDRKLDPKISSLYSGWEFPLGICVAEGDGYRLIDGHHRFAENTSPKKHKVTMVVAT